MNFNPGPPIIASHPMILILTYQDFARIPPVIPFEGFQILKSELRLRYVISVKVISAKGLCVVHNI